MSWPILPLQWPCNTALKTKGLSDFSNFDTTAEFGSLGIRAGWKEREGEGGSEKYGNGVRVKEIEEKQRLYILPIPPGLTSSLFIASHIKVSSLIFSTADIVISPAEVIHHQGNITPPTSPSFLFLLIFITTVAFWSLALSSPFRLCSSKLLSIIFSYSSALPPGLQLYVKDICAKSKEFNWLLTAIAQPETIPWSDFALK